MLFKTIAELISITTERNLKISDVMLMQEEISMNRPKSEIFSEMSLNLDVMEQSVERGLSRNEKSRSGLTGGDAQKLQHYMLNSKNVLSSTLILDSISRATATSEINAAMGTIVATPTAGACGVLPGVIFTTAKSLNLEREVMVRALFVAGAIGLVIANNACISGASGGCQAEVGSASGMAAAALVEMAGGTPEESGEAMAIALKNMLGLVCDPVAGLVEAPCVKRNAMGASIALVAADMALAGVKSIIPPDEVIGAMHRISQIMPMTLRETALGGLANTPTGKKLEQQIFGQETDKIKNDVKI